MEAVNAILGGGLRVGVLLRGKTIRDDNITLFQTGISQDNEMDMLGFTLEPNISQAPLQSFPDNRPCQLLHNDPQPLTRYFDGFCTFKINISGAITFSAFCPSSNELVTAYHLA